MIHFSRCLHDSLKEVHSPPVTELDSFPFHTQSVERCVKIVTEAAAACCQWSRKQRLFYSSTIAIARTDANYLKPKKTTAVTQSDSG